MVNMLYVPFGALMLVMYDKAMLRTIDTQYNNKDPQLNPVSNWAFTVRRIRSYPGFDPSWEVSTYYKAGRFSKITSVEMINEIKFVVSGTGQEILGFTADNVGLHSVHGSLAMLMYLAKEPVYTIILVGRWSSDAFLAYIEKQIKKFTKGVSSQMLQHETFCNIPAFSNRAPLGAAPPRRQSGSPLAEVPPPGHPQGSFWPSRVSPPRSPTQKLASKHGSGLFLGVWTLATPH